MLQIVFWYEFIFLQTRDLKIAYSLTAGTYFAIGLIFYSCFPLAKECIEQVCCNYLSWRSTPEFECNYYRCPNNSISSLLVRRTIDNGLNDPTNQYLYEKCPGFEYFIDRWVFFLCIWDKGLIDIRHIAMFWNSFIAFTSVIGITSFCFICFKLVNTVI